MGRVVVKIVYVMGRGKRNCENLLALEEDQVAVLGSLFGSNSQCNGGGEKERKKWEEWGRSINE